MKTKEATLMKLHTHTTAKRLKVKIILTCCAASLFCIFTDGYAGECNDTLVTLSDTQYYISAASCTRGTPGAVGVGVTSMTLYGVPGAFGPNCKVTFYNPTTSDSEQWTIANDFCSTEGSTPTASGPAGLNYLYVSAYTRGEYCFMCHDTTAGVTFQLRPGMKGLSKGL
ncbi:MAG: hypothetical protein A3F13_09775 [Gammaproteobacteria bacterium RIFCSPHIGHO2_12_FULL_40_19]|nr:MAG: hypothetical protein A3F13_09775 [Gammaproteobacteria bacterium RIFCSPHIGHO2_12_FULL_40_19]